MSLPNWLNRGFGALMETSNLVSLTILVVAWLLTADLPLLLIGITVELTYLGLASLITGAWISSSPSMPTSLVGWLTWYRKRLDTWLGRFRRPEDSKPEDNFALDQVLLIVTVAGFVVIIFFGFGKHLLSHRWYDLTHAEGWEAGALVWTGLFLIYYLIKFRATGNVTVDKVIMAVLVAGNVWLLWQAAKSIGGKPLDHIPYVMAIALCFFFIDLLTAFIHEDPIEKVRSRASFYWADIPMVFSFLVLFAYLRAHRDTEAPEVFVAGVIACQLLISNAVFVVMEFGLLRSADSAALGGHVQDASGTTISAALVEAKSLNANLSQTTTTDGEGKFSFPYLPSGKIDLTIDAEGFPTLTRSLILTPGQSLDLGLALGVDN